MTLFCLFSSSPEPIGGGFINFELSVLSELICNKENKDEGTNYVFPCSLPGVLVEN